MAVAGVAGGCRGTVGEPPYIYALETPLQLSPLSSYNIHTPRSRGRIPGAFTRRRIHTAAGVGEGAGVGASPSRSRLLSRARIAYSLAEGPASL